MIFVKNRSEIEDIYRIINHVTKEEDWKEIYTNNSDYTRVLEFFLLLNYLLIVHLLTVVKKQKP